MTEIQQTDDLSDHDGRNLLEKTIWPSVGTVIAATLLLIALLLVAVRHADVYELAQSRKALSRTLKDTQRRLALDLGTFAGLAESKTGTANGGDFNRIDRALRSSTEGIYLEQGLALSAIVTDDGKMLGSYGKRYLLGGDTGLPIRKLWELFANKDTTGDGGPAKSGLLSIHDRLYIAAMTPLADPAATLENRTLGHAHRALVSLLEIDGNFLKGLSQITT